MSTVIKQVQEYANEKNALQTKYYFLELIG